MGKNKILIKQISNKRLRNITYNKRKNGLLKKAAELGMLCDVPVILYFGDVSGNFKLNYSKTNYLFLIGNLVNFTIGCK